MPPDLSNPQTCKHRTLTYLSSPHVESTQYEPIPAPDLRNAAQCNRAFSKSNVRAPTETELPNIHSWAFPAPLLLPGDALEEGPDEGIQTLRDWHSEPHRNPVTASRRTIYVCASPSISRDVDQAHQVRSWTVPKTGQSKTAPVQRPDVGLVVEYLSAFYHGLPVKLLNANLRFVPWDDEPKRITKQSARGSGKSNAPLHIGLATADECVRVRTRHVSGSPFERQLHLNDILDVASTILPKDAYAIVMLVDHDIYESEDDDFCCGRAYGGSRISVVSTARYNPALDEADGLDHAHAWPASHCLDFVLRQCEAASCAHLDPPPKRAKQKKGVAKPASESSKIAPAESLLHQAVSAHDAAHSTDLPALHRELWLSRVCKTASHELGHCFGISHCVFYACIMQSTSGAAEDSEQPPYLCPVDQRKVLAATGSGLLESYRAMKAFCVNRSQGRLWAAFRTWLEGRIQQLERSMVVIDLTDTA